MGCALALRADASDEALERACAMLAATRPTAINLKWALDEMVAAVRNRPREERLAAAYRRAAEICEEDVAINQAIGRHGAKLIAAIAANKKSGEPVAGAHPLQCRLARDRRCRHRLGADLSSRTITGVPLHVWVDETRPRNQGAALTAWELGQHGVPHTVIADNTGGHLMQHGMVDVAIVGADRVTANGDVCNKIGTYLKALAAKDNDVPFYVGLPSPTIDFSLSDGRAEIPIEQRGADEVATMTGRTARRPHRARARRAGRLGGGELRLRRDAGAAGHRPHHRARHHRAAIATRSPPLSRNARRQARSPDETRSLRRSRPHGCLADHGVLLELTLGN